MAVAWHKMLSNKITEKSDKNLLKGKQNELELVVVVATSMNEVH